MALVIDKTDWHSANWGRVLRESKFAPDFGDEFRIADSHVASLLDAFLKEPQ